MFGFFRNVGSRKTWFHVWQSTCEDNCPKCQSRAAVSHTSWVTLTSQRRYYETQQPLNPFFFLYVCWQMYLLKHFTNCFSHRSACQIRLPTDAWLSAFTFPHAQGSCLQPLWANGNCLTKMFNLQKGNFKIITAIHKFLKSTPAGKSASFLGDHLTCTYTHRERGCGKLQKRDNTHYIKCRRERWESVSSGAKFLKAGLECHVTVNKTQSPGDNDLNQRQVFDYEVSFTHAH